MELSITREITGYAATQETASILLNMKVHYRIHKSSPVVQLCNDNLIFLHSHKRSVFNIL
jgi:hypothetical protein